MAEVLRDECTIMDEVTSVSTKQEKETPTQRPMQGLFDLDHLWQWADNTLSHVERAVRGYLIEL